MCKGRGSAIQGGINVVTCPLEPTPGAKTQYTQFLTVPRIVYGQHGSICTLPIATLGSAYTPLTGMKRLTSKTAARGVLREKFVTLHAARRGWENSPVNGIRYQHVNAEC